jgi:arylsulfatase A-like enzyme
VINRSVLFSDPRLESLLAIYRDIKANVPVVRTIDVVSGGSESVEETLDGRADVTTAAVLDWMKQHLVTNTEPFFLWVHYFDPHYPYSPPPGFDHVFNLDYHGTIDGSVKTIHGITEDKTLVPTAADIARLEELYQGEIAYTDSQLARLLTELEARGLEDHTIIAVTGDHGESFGEHGDWTHGLEVYETEIHVPVLLRYPGLVPPGQVIAEPVQLVDIMPTLLDLTGIRPPRPVQGTSFLPLITPPTESKPAPARAAFTELADESFNSIVTQEWKLIRNNANEEIQLYHISQDEAEKRNLAADQPAVARELNARLGDLMRISGVSK